ncbi:MAG: hypothetical protein QOI37_1399 [Chloroflexota bacterium]|nr:hypothetical protein [Chloroflexota bacterium]
MIVGARLDRRQGVRSARTWGYQHSDEDSKADRTPGQQQERPRRRLAGARDQLESCVFETGGALDDIVDLRSDREQRECQEDHQNGYGDRAPGAWSHGLRLLRAFVT